MIPVTLPNNTTVTAYPITTPQQFMFFMAAQYGAKYPVNNIGSCYFVHGDMDFEKMEEALKQAIDRCDTMRMRFAPNETYKIVQYITEKSELEIEHWDLSDMPFEDAKAKLHSISREEIPTFNCEIHKIALVKFEKGINGIFMRHHHLAMDAYSVKVFLRDVLEIYLHLTEGAPYPKPMRPYIPVMAKELAYLKSPQKEADKKYWFDSLATTSEPIFTDYMLNNRLAEQRKEFPEHRYADIHSGSPEAGTMIFSMSAEDSKKIMDKCEEENLSMCAYISMGVRSTLSVFNNNEEDVSFKMIVNRRGSIAEKKSGGIRINFFPMRSILKADQTWKEGVNKISEIQNEIYQHCSLSFMEMLIERHKSMPKDAKGDSTYDSLGLSYQPVNEIPCIGGYHCDSVWFNNGASMIPLYITVKHRTADNGLDFIFEFRKTPDPVYDLNIFYKKLSGLLLQASENTNTAIGDLLNNHAITAEEREGKN